MADALLVALVLLFALGASLVLYVLIEGETADRQTMNRDDAERTARERAGERYGDGESRSRR